jgi:hypothetical protein
MKTVGELGLKPGDVVKREDGTLGVVVLGDAPDWREGMGQTYVWWHHDTTPSLHHNSKEAAWEVVPKPVPTVASLGLKVGDVVRWGTANWLVQLFGSESVFLIAPSGQASGVKLAAPVPEGFRKVVIE